MTDEKTPPPAVPLTAKEWAEKSLEERRAFLASVAPNIAESFEEEHPRWMAGTLLDILRNSLENLRHYLEDGTDPEVSWASPFLELQYAVGWNWEHGAMTEEAMPDAALVSLETAVSWMSERFARHLDLEVLKMFTKGAAFRVKGEETVSLVAPDIQEFLDSMPEDERDAYLADFGDAFVMGGTYFSPGEDFEEEAEDLELEDEDGEVEVVPEAHRLTARGAGRLEDTKPLLPFTGDQDGKKFTGSVVFALHPLLVDEDKRKAFYPVVVGIELHPMDLSRPDGIPVEGEPFEPTPPDPTTWTEEDRGAFWKALLDGLDEVRKGFQDDAVEPLGVEVRAETGSVQAVGLSATVSATSSASGTAETDTRSTRSTMEVFRPPDAAGVPVGAPPPSRTRFLVDSPTRLSQGTNAFLSKGLRLNLPRKWASIPRWEDLVEKEKTRLLDTMGERAFDSRPGYPALLETRYVTKTKSEEVRLTKAGLRNLEETEGPKCFRRVDTDPDKMPREYLVRTLRVEGGGTLEFAVSMYGSTWTLVGDGPDIEEARLRAYKQGDLFEELPAHLQERVESRIRNLEHVRDAPDMLEHIARKFGAEGVNPVHFSAAELRDAVLKCGGDPDGLARVRGCLRALEEVTFKLTSKGGEDPFLISGRFLSGVTWIPHRTEGDGDFYLSVSPALIGGLRIFEVPGSRLRDVREITVFDWRKKLTKGDRKSMRGFLRGATRLAVVLFRAAGFTDHQKRLFRWIESQRTTRGDPAPKHRRASKVGPRSQEVNEPRLYGRDFCPLIPEGKVYGAALGRFRPSPESGWTLYGTPTGATETGGGHTGGLISVLGYSYPPGRAHKQRSEVVKKVLEDFRVVVVEVLGGLVAARWEGRWYSLEDAARLDDEVKVRKLKWFLFLPADFRGRVKEYLEAHDAGRFERKETPFLWKVRNEPADVAPEPPPAPAEGKGEGEGERASTGLVGTPAWVRLAGERKVRKMTQAAVGSLFGVSQRMAAYWEEGPEKGKSIPPDLEPLVLRWLDGGPPPSPEELDARRTRRSGRPEDPAGDV